MSFAYKNGVLHAENVNVKDIAKEVGTPFYLYSSKIFSDNFLEFKNAFTKQKTTICFAVKSNSNIAVLKLLGSLGAGADTVSEGEIRRALLAGISAEKIVFSGVGKTKEEIKFALENNVGQFNVESREELEMIDKIASDLGTVAKISVRLNPNVDAKTHEKISTGRKHDKFGVPWEEAFETYALAGKLKNIEVQGLAAHIGSQITKMEPYVEAFKKMADMAKALKDKGHNITRIDLGGGVGIRYRDETPIKIADYAMEIEKIISGLGVELFLEPGRRISADAGVLISEVQFIKNVEDKHFAIIDAGMNDLARPAIYGAYHEIISVDELEKNMHYDVVGPVCESSDIFGRDTKIGELKGGDLIAINQAGAYGFVMASNYNTRGLVAEVMVIGSEFKTIRKRQTFEEIIFSENF